MDTGIHNWTIWREREREKFGVFSSTQDVFITSPQGSGICARGGRKTVSIRGDGCYGKLFSRQTGTLRDSGSTHKAHMGSNQTNPSTEKENGHKNPTSYQEVIRNRHRFLEWSHWSHQPHSKAGPFSGVAG